MRHHAALRDSPGLALPADVRLINAAATALFALGAVMAAALVLLWLTRQPMFSIRGIRVEGDVLRNSVSTIRANALPRLAGNYFWFDLARGKSAFESVPWVRQAVVRRVWPDRLSVRLEEHRPAALWSQTTQTRDGDDQLVNQEGEVFQANLGDVEDESLPTLQGPEGSSAEMLAMYRRVAPLFERIDMHLDSLALSGRGSWRAGFDSGAEVELGRGGEDEVAVRTEKFVATVMQVVARYGRPLVYADLRHNQGYALRLKGVTTMATPTAAGRN